MENVIKLLQFIDEAKRLVDTNASDAERKDFIARVGDEVLVEGLGEKNAAILKQYVDVIKDVVDPNTTTQLRGDAIKKLGLIVADKLNFEVFDHPETPEGKSALKLITALKGLAGAIDVIRHNEDPNDQTKLSGEVVKGLVLNMLDNFNLGDDFKDIDKDVRKFLDEGVRNLVDAIKNQKGIDPLEVAVRVTDLLDDGYDVMRDLFKAAPDLKAMLKYITDGTKAIAQHVKAQFKDVGGMFHEFGQNVKIIHAEHMHARLMNKLEAEDGDGYKDGKWNEFVEDTKAFGKACDKFMGATGHLFKELLGFGHEDVKVAEKVVTEAEVIESNLAAHNPNTAIPEDVTTTVANDNTGEVLGNLSDNVPLHDAVHEG